MSPDFQSHMADATRLTRAGDLQAATALIQAALSGSALAVGAESMAPSRAPASDVIDVVDRVVHPCAADAQVLPGARVANVNSGSKEDVVPAELGADAAPQEGQEVSGTFRHPSAGTRDYRLYVPPTREGQALPLILMLHGCTQTPQDFAAGTRMTALARSEGFFVLYPAQSPQYNPQRCWNWFKHNHQQRGRGEPALLAELVRHVKAEHRVDPARVYVAGLSAGGAMAAVLGQAYPDLFAAVGVHSGLAPGAARDLPSALAAMQHGAAGRTDGGGWVPTIVFHGDRDVTVHPSNAAQVMRSARSAEKAEVKTEQVSSASKRASTRQVHRDAEGRAVAELWLVHGAAHAWSGGSTAGSYTDPQGPDASGEMLRFFKEHRLTD